MLQWLPQYLLLERHYSTRTMALTGWLPFCATAAGAASGGWVSDAWIRRGGSPTLVRKTFAITGLSGCGALLMPAALAEDQVLAMSMLFLAALIHGRFSTKLWVVTRTLAGS